MQESIQDKAPERPAQAGQLKVSTGGAAAPFVDNRPSSAAQLKLAQMAQAAPKVVAQRRQMNVIHHGTAQLEEDDESLQGKMEPVQRAVIDGVEVPDEPEQAQHPVQHPQVPAEQTAPEQVAAEQAMVEQGEVPGTPAPAPAPEAVQDPNGQQDPNADAAAMPAQVLGDAPNAEAAPVANAGAEEQVGTEAPPQAPVQHPVQHPIQNPTEPEEEVAPVQQKADPAQLAAKDNAADGVRQFAIVRTWGDEEPAAAPARAPAGPQGAQAGMAPQMPYPPHLAYSMQYGNAPAPAPAPKQEKLGFFGRMKQGVKNAAGRMGQWLLNWSGRGKQQQAPSSTTNINIFNGGSGGQQPGMQQPQGPAPAGPKVYVPNEKRVGARRIASRDPVARGAAAAEQKRMMMERMSKSAEPTPAPAMAPAADPNAANAAPVAAPNGTAGPNPGP